MSSRLGVVGAVALLLLGVLAMQRFGEEKRGAADPDSGRAIEVETSTEVNESITDEQRAEAPQKHSHETVARVLRPDDECKVSLIMISKRQHGEKAAARADEVAARLRRSESFAELAKTYTDLRRTRRDGGKLAGGAWTTLAEVARDEIAAQLTTLVPGEWLKLELGSAIFLLRMDDRRPRQELPPLEPEQERLKAMLFASGVTLNYGRSLPDKDGWSLPDRGCVFWNHMLPQALESKAADEHPTLLPTTIHIVEPGDE